MNSNLLGLAIAFVALSQPAFASADARASRLAGELSRRLTPEDRRALRSCTAYRNAIVSLSVGGGALHLECLSLPSRLPIRGIGEQPVQRSARFDLPALLSAGYRIEGIGGRVEVVDAEGIVPGPTLKAAADLIHKEFEREREAELLHLRLEEQKRMLQRM